LLRDSPLTSTCCAGHRDRSSVPRLSAEE
jgi:hypothetical protein